MAANKNDLLRLRHNKKIIVASAPSRGTKTWRNQEIWVSQLVTRLGKVVRTSETVSAYGRMGKDAQDKLKDVGGWVGGGLLKGVRKVEAVQSRTVITLDADYAGARFKDEVALALGEWVYTLHGTRTAGRYRLIVYPDRPIRVEEYEAVARKVAELVDINAFDATCYRLNQLMYFPSVSDDQAFDFEHNDEAELGFLCVDDVLASYGVDAAGVEAWRDSENWPIANGERQVQNNRFVEAGDPLKKTGVVGCFCRSFGINEAIEAFLGDVYRRETNNRYTFIGGSSSKGLVVYENKLCYSNHATDPAGALGGSHCHNAFDLVRIHKFGSEDGGVRADCKVNNLPSYKLMTDFAMSIEPVKLALVDEIRGSVPEETWFDHEGLTAGEEREEWDTLSIDDELEEWERIAGDRGEAAVEDFSWRGQLEVTKDGRIKNTYRNCELIVCNEPDIRDALAYDEFSMNKMYKKYRLWTDADTLNLRSLIPARYGNVDFSERHVYNASEACANRNKYHPVRDYFSGLAWDGKSRISTMLQRHLMVTDTPFARSAQVCWMVAAVRRIRRPGYKFDNVLVIGGGQNAGKTTFLNLLARGVWYGELHTVDRQKVVETATGKLILDFDELAVMSRADHNAFKSFTSSQSTKVRLAYRRDAVEFQHAFVLAGTTNEQRFLTDPTGNRRFWPMMCNMPDGQFMDEKAFSSEVDQLWAEAVHLEKLGQATFLPDHLYEEVKQLQAECEVHDDIIDTIHDWLSGANLIPNKLTTQIIIERALEIKSANSNKSLSNRVGVAMRKLGYELKKAYLVEAGINGKKTVYRPWVWVLD
jgi:putative DNA primase/helicase